MFTKKLFEFLYIAATLPPLFLIAIGISELTYSEITQTISGEGNFELIKSVVFLDRLIGYYFIVGIGSIIIILNRPLFRNMAIIDK